MTEFSVDLREFKLDRSHSLMDEFLSLLQGLGLACPLSRKLHSVGHVFGW